VRLSKKSKNAILEILHVMKSTGDEHQNYRFRVLRQSLQKEQISNDSKPM